MSRIAHLRYAPRAARSVDPAPGRACTAAPHIVRELSRGESVVCDLIGAEQVLAWAKAHPAWIEDPAPVYAHDPNQ